MENNIKEEVHLEKKRQPWDDLALTFKFMKSLVQCWANSKHHQERRYLDSSIYSRVQGKQHETESRESDSFEKMHTPQYFWQRYLQ